MSAAVTACGTSESRSASDAGYRQAQDGSASRDATTGSADARDAGRNGGHDATTSTSDAAPEADTGCGTPDGAGDAAWPFDAPLIAPITSGGWAWSSQVPQGDPIYGVWAAASDDVWAVTSTTSLHYDGQSWSLVPLPGRSTGEAYFGNTIWGSGPTDVWIAGPPVYHFDGTSWSVVAAAPECECNSWSVGGSGPNDVWLLESGEAGQFAHYDGTVWTTYPIPSVTEDAGIPIPNATSSGGVEVTFGSIWASSPADAWATGYGAASLPGDAETFTVVALFHWNGAAWSTANVFTTPSSVPFSSALPIWGSGPDDVWAGVAGQVLHWDGSAWAPVPLASGCGAASALWGATASDVWMACSSGVFFSHWNGTVWSSLPPVTGTPPVAIAGSSGSDIWAMGGSSMYHYDGSRWFFTNPSEIPDGMQISLVCGSSPTEAWLVAGNYGVFRWNGTWWATAPNSCSIGSPTAMWANASDDVWAASSDTTGTSIAHWNGTAWSQPWSTTFGYNAPQPETSPGAMWGSGPSDVWFVGTGTAHWNGTTWSVLATPAPPAGLTSIWGSGATDVWAVGQARSIHWDGNTWTAVALPGTGIAWSATPNVWGSGPDDVWIVGYTTDALHWDGASWTEKASPVGFTTIAGYAASDVWASDGYGLYHWDGNNWTIGSSFNLSFNSSYSGVAPAITGTSTTGLWATVGSSLFHHP